MTRPAIAIAALLAIAWSAPHADPRAQVIDVSATDLLEY